MKMHTTKSKAKCICVPVSMNQIDGVQDAFVVPTIWSVHVPRSPHRHRKISQSHVSHTKIKEFRWKSWIRTQIGQPKEKSVLIKQRTCLIFCLREECDIWSDSSASCECTRLSCDSSWDWTCCVEICCCCTWTCWFPTTFKQKQEQKRNSWEFIFKNGKLYRFGGKIIVYVHCDTR